MFKRGLESLETKNILFLLISSIVLVGCSDNTDPDYPEPTSTLPTLTTANATRIASNSATLGGEIMDEGTPTYTERGLCYSTVPNPTTEHNRTPIAGSGIGRFSTTLSGLTPSTTYYVRSYAVNFEGTAYGEQVSFTTLAIGEIPRPEETPGEGGTGPNSGLPTLSTAEASNMGSVSATLGGEITHEGTPPYTERGVCYSISPNPTTADNRTPIPGSGTGNFSINLNNLMPNTLYYVRSYATSAAGTVYGAQVSFTTLVLPTLTTANATNITSNSAVLGGNIVHVGTPAYTERGVCYSISPNPTALDGRMPIAGSGTGSFSATLSGLPGGGTYYARAYAINAAGIAYGAQVSFSTPIAPITAIPARYNHLLDRSQYPNDRNTAYSNNSVLIVGNQHSWMWAPWPGVWTYEYAARGAALYFNINSHILGRNIRRAELRLYVQNYAASRDVDYRVSAFADLWNTGITWTMANNLRIYTNPPSVIQAPPSSSPWVVDVTHIVQCWANNLCANNGFLLMENNPVPTVAPNSPDRGTVFWNVHSAPAGQQPVLHVEFQ
ncbi:MAG: DNRLRE domain-containing protein [Cystobacterineae bacterium]|nr:DNRLRE domain-containing protein [Cystobacterineae bacterium]